MSLNDSTREKIENLIKQNRVVLFMKGTPQAPMCGFSSKTVGLLDSILNDYSSVDVLEDQEIREGIKVFGNWPTIPQLYIDGELVGGCDIVTAMFNSNELHDMLGVEAPDRTPPEVTITDAAAEKILEAMAGNDGIGLHFAIDAGWQSQFNVAPAEGHEIKVVANGITLLFDLASAQRARGAVIDWVETMQGSGLTINLPQAPKPVNQMSVADLKAGLDSTSVILIDVRGGEERALASLEAARAMDGETMQEIEALPKDTRWPLSVMSAIAARLQPSISAKWVSAMSVMWLVELTPGRKKLTRQSPSTAALNKPNPSDRPVNGAGQIR